MQAQELAKKMKSGQSPCVLDVRSGGEYRAGHIPGAVHAPSWKILLRVASLPEKKDAPVVVTCENGPRAMLAKSFLDARGYRNVELLEGHMAGWRRGGLPTER